MFVLNAAFTFAQAPDLKFKQISVEQGLSSGYVFSTCQDNRGFMWFGTLNGLDRYDGITMQVYRHDQKDTTTVSDNFIRCMYNDHRGDLWIGTANGLSHYNANKNSFTSYRNTPEDS